MPPSDKNKIVVASAGARKTQLVVESALKEREKSTLILTYTTENQREIIRRLNSDAGCIPDGVVVMGWLPFLLQQCIRPYQAAVLGAPGLVGEFNFAGQPPAYAKKTQRAYWIDSNNDVYREYMADLACECNKSSGGAVVRRLESIYSSILIDEFQDLVGYDLDLIDLLFTSEQLEVTVVGDPRQHTYGTNQSRRNKKYRGDGLLRWVDERKNKCQVDIRNISYRCNQAICDFADALYPELPDTESLNKEETGHDGVFVISRAEVAEYVKVYRPVILRQDRRTNTEKLPGMNIGVSKGRTFDRVLVFPSKPVREYMTHRDPSKLKARERLYVAATRARFSATFVV